MPKNDSHHHGKKYEILRNQKKEFDKTRSPEPPRPTNAYKKNDKNFDGKKKNQK
jgi:hypothetical protein